MTAADGSMTTKNPGPPPTADPKTAQPGDTRPGPAGHSPPGATATGTADPGTAASGSAATDRTIPTCRLGPRPLGLHLGLAAATWLSSRSGLQSLNAGWLPWMDTLRHSRHRHGRHRTGDGPVTDAGIAEDITALQSEIAKHDPDRFGAAVDREARRRLGRLMDGITAYQRHPYRRRLTDPPLLWQDGGTRLLDYGAVPEATDPAGPPVLVVPSLINRSYILDLKPDCSFLRAMAAAGLRPLMVDWGAPGAVERDFSLSDYIAGRLDAALDAARAASGGRPPALVGYCMGGLLALGLAARRQPDLTGLAVLATPWNFHADRPDQARLASSCMLMLEPVIATLGELPVDALQAMFGAIEPFGVAGKFVAFADLAPDSARAEAFVALEDWINDGVPLAAAVARECLVGWYGENRPATGRWRIAGRPVDPAGIALPGLVVIPQHDRIVPPGSAAALADAWPGSIRLQPRFGHIGMIAGRRARTAVWQPVFDWLHGTAR